MSGAGKEGRSKRRKWGKRLTDYTAGYSQRVPAKASKRSGGPQKHSEVLDLAPSLELLEAFATRVFELPTEDDQILVTQIESFDCPSSEIFDGTPKPGSMDKRW